jgi:N utilization substance protein A
VNKEISMHLDALSNIKGLSKEIVFSVAEEGIKEALVAIMRKKTGVELSLEVSINRETGDYSVVQVKEIVEDEDFTSAETQITLSDARKIEPDCEVGEEIREPLVFEEFGRMVSRHAKQAIMKKIREAEMLQTAQAYQNRIGELFTIVVQRVTREQVTGDLGDNSVEGIFLREEMLPREAVRTGDRLRGYLYEVKSDIRGTQLYLTRTRPEMLTELFRLEVPEIAEQLIEVKSAARDPGIRAKIAVKTNDGRIDPIGACVGMRGSRVQAVSGELGGERVDIILWNDNPAQLVINAMAPAEVSSIVVDEDSHSIDVAVEEEQLALAIGKNGQNVRLASILTGWNINIMTKEDAQQKHQAETQRVVDLLMKELDVDEDLAKTLVDQGFTNAEEVAYVPAEELLAIDGFDEDIVEALRRRAKDMLLTKAIVSEENLSGQQPAEDLLALKGMTLELAKELAAQGILTREDLAEQGVADLLDITKKLNAAKAAELIMAARAHWFSEESSEKK